MRSPLLSTSDVTLVCPWAGEENGLTCDTAFKAFNRWKRDCWWIPFNLNKITS
ncbi:unnamed protein product, partial [Nesidiocoris tenuis]